MERPRLIPSGAGFSGEDEGVAFERHATEKVISRLGLWKEKHRIAAACADAPLNFRALTSVVTDLPCTFRTLNTYSARKLTLVRLFITPHKQEAVKRYFELVDELSDRDRPLALIVRTDGFNDGLVFHRMYTDTSTANAEMTLRFGKNVDPIFVQTFASFMDDVKELWSR